VPRCFSHGFFELKTPQNNTGVLISRSFHNLGASSGQHSHHNYHKYDYGCCRCHCWDIDRELPNFQSPGTCLALQPPKILIAISHNSSCVPPGSFEHQSDRSCRRGLRTLCGCDPSMRGAAFRWVPLRRSAVGGRRPVGGGARGQRGMGGWEGFGRGCVSPNFFFWWR